MTTDKYHFNIPFIQETPTMNIEIIDEEMNKFLENSSQKEEILSKGYESRSKNGSAVKDDAKKPRMSLVPILAKREVARVMTYGANKYADYNWANGFDYTILADAAERHIDDWRCGIDFDPDSGERTLAHAICSLMMLLENTLLYGDRLDDRWKGWKADHGKQAVQETHRPLILKKKK